MHGTGHISSMLYISSMGRISDYDFPYLESNVMSRGSVCKVNSEPISERGGVREKIVMVNPAAERYFLDDKDLGRG